MSFVASLQRILSQRARTSSHRVLDSIHHLASDICSHKFGPARNATMTAKYQISPAHKHRGWLLVRAATSVRRSSHCTDLVAVHKRKLGAAFHKSQRWTGERDKEKA